MLDISYIFDKIKTPIQSFPLCNSSETPDKNPHCSFGSSSSYVYCPPSPCDFVVKLLEYINYFDDSYLSSDLMHFFLETLLSLRQNLNFDAYNYQHSVPKSYRLLMHRADANITYMENKLLAHS